MKTAKHLLLFTALAFAVGIPLHSFADNLFVGAEVNMACGPDTFVKNRIDRAIDCRAQDKTITHRPFDPEKLGVVKEIDPDHCTATVALPTGDIVRGVHLSHLTYKDASCQDTTTDNVPSLDDLTPGDEAFLFCDLKDITPSLLGEETACAGSEKGGWLGWFRKRTKRDRKVLVRMLYQDQTADVLLTDRGTNAIVPVSALFKK